MKIGLIDVDGHNFPNLALMRISAYHKAKGDDVEWWFGDLVYYDIVYMSKIFSDAYTKDVEEPWNAGKVIKGGTGYCISLVNGKEVFDKTKNTELPPEIEKMFPDYSIYPEHDFAVAMTSRGCPNGCGFCHVASKEGKCSYKVADLDEFWKGQKKIVLSDPNILACKDHKELLQQLIDSKAKVEFNQGLDIRMINNDNLDLLRQVKLTHIHFAFDRYQDKDIIEPRLRAFHELGYDRGKGKVMVYILVNYDTALEQDIERIQLCRELNFSPYPMIYDKEHADPIYRKLQRWCSNYIFWSVPTFEEYSAR